LFLFSLPVSARVVRGTLLNDDDPYFIKGDDGKIYKAEWYWGSTLFSEGDLVILTDNDGEAKMIDETMDETADVSVEEISTEYPSIMVRPVPTPNLTPLPPAPSYPPPAPTPTGKPTPTQSPTATPTLAPHYNNTKWPDGRMLIHPEHFMKAYVINVPLGDTLKLRSGPGTKYAPVTEIPADGTGITAFDQDQVWDGDTWWCPVEWHGLRGYVGRHYLPNAH